MPNGWWQSSPSRTVRSPDCLKEKKGLEIVAGLEPMMMIVQRRAPLGVD